MWMISKHVLQVELTGLAHRFYAEGKEEKALNGWLPQVFDLSIRVLLIQFTKMGLYYQMRFNSEGNQEFSFGFVSLRYLLDIREETYIFNPLFFPILFLSTRVIKTNTSSAWKYFE